MSVTTTSLGTNTKQITLASETSSANFITALDTAITGMGWSQADVSNQYVRIYSAPNADGVTTKYAGIYIDPITLKLSTTSFESWNATTHVGTNEVWTFNRAGQMGYALNLCDVIVMASSHWLVLQTFIRNQASVWSGVFELAREAPEDTTTLGVPCWGWMSSALIFSQPFIANSVTTSISMPRTYTGNTGVNAALNAQLVTPLGRYGNTNNLGTSPSTLTSMMTYSWDTSKKMACAPRVLLGNPTNGNQEFHGHIYGLKLTYNIGSPYNVASMLVDSNYNYSPSGSAANFWVLGAAPVTNPINILNTTSSGNGYATVTSQTVTNGRVAVPVGTNFYITTTSGVSKVDASGSTLGTASTVSGISSSCNGICYDNVQYLFVATAAGVYRIDTLNSDAVTLVASTAATLNVAYDGTNIWAIGSTSQTNVPLYVINPSTAAITNSYTLGNASAAQAFNMTVDNANNAYVGCNNGLVYKITSAGTVSTFVSGLPTTNIYQIGLFFNGVNLVVITAQYAAAFVATTYTLAGVQVATQAITLNTLNPSWTRLDAFKLGAYDVFNTYSANGAFGTTTNSGFSNGTVIGSTYLGLPAATMISMGSDGNRVWGSGSNGIFYYWTNVFHPDETATTYGRLLLPQ